MDRHVGRTQALAVGEGGVGDDADLDAEIVQPQPDQFGLRPTDEIGEDPVGVDDPAVSVAVDDEVAERVDEAEEVLVAFVKLPHPVGHALDAGGGRGRVCRLDGRVALRLEASEQQIESARADQEKAGNEVWHRAPQEQGGRRQMRERRPPWPSEAQPAAT